jgi:hypothetical protein
VQLDERIPAGFTPERAGFSCTDAVFALGPVLAVAVNRRRRLRLAA